jgi:putative membrane protein
MKILVLSVDRDDDFGVKAGMNSPFIGREENLEAAIALGMKDPEDCDVNTVLAALSIYDEMAKKGMDVEVATICGDPKVGFESDLVLATQLENVLETIKPERVILVSDGAEDEFIYPMVFSRVKVDSVRRVWVKQAPTVEGTYYILMKMMQDDKVRKRVLTPIGLVLAVLGIFALLPKLVELYMDTTQISLISDMAFGSIALVLGVYLLVYAYKVADRVVSWYTNTGRAIRSGSQMIPFAILTIILVFIGVFFGVEAANANPDADIVQKALLFANATLWMWAFAVFSFETGRFVNHYLSTGKVYWAYLVVSVTVFAISFIVQGSLDASLFFLGYSNLNQNVIFLEILSGFLLMGFSGLINTNLKTTLDQAIRKEEEADQAQYPEA